LTRPVMVRSTLCCC